MFNIRFNGQETTSKPNETLLECLLRSNINIDFSCKSGVCHRCMSKCLEDELSNDATRKLPITHRGKNYLLACQCVPVSDMVVEAKSSDDNITQCIAVNLEHENGNVWQLAFESYRVINYQTGQRAAVMSINMQDEIIGVLSSDPDNDALTVLQFEQQDLPHWLNESSQDINALEFYLRGPLTEQQERPPLLAPNPELWQQLGGDSKIYEILNTFYHAVYADAQLAPFFERITIERITGKQFSFLKKHILGEDGFIGEDPKNSHNWMVVNHNLFNHRIELMRRILRDYAVSETLIQQFEAYEEQFRPDIVKNQPWPKQIGDQFIDTERFEECVLDEATICDYCSAEIPANTMVKYHLRIGKLACKDCSTTSESTE